MGFNIFELKEINVILFDGPERSQLLPFTYTRPVAELRVGIDTLREKWDFFLETKSSYATQAYLVPKYSQKTKGLNYFVNPTFIPTEKLAKQIKELQENQALVSKGRTVAYCTTNTSQTEDTFDFEEIRVEEQLIQIVKCSDLFSKNAAVIELDFERLTHNRVSHCLLYTSPSPRDLSTSRMPSSA